MAEEHDKLVATFVRTLLRRKYKLLRRAPFVDYRPDVFAAKGKKQLFAEIEIERTLHSDHTLGQLLIMHEYVVRSKHRIGFLVVPRRATSQASLLLASLFGDGKIKVQGL